MGYFRWRRWLLLSGVWVRSERSMNSVFHSGISSQRRIILHSILELKYSIAQGIDVLSHGKRTHTFSHGRIWNYISLSKFVSLYIHVLATYSEIKYSICCHYKHGNYYVSFNIFFQVDGSAIFFIASCPLSSADSNLYQRILIITI